MTPRFRNDIVARVMSEITAEGEFFLGFVYDKMKQSGSCNCVATNFLRIPKFTVVHKKSATVLYFRTHHGDTERMFVVNGDEEQFTSALTKKLNRLIKYANDWD